MSISKPASATGSSGPSKALLVTFVLLVGIAITVAGVLLVPGSEYDPLHGPPAPDATLSVQTTNSTATVTLSAVSNATRLVVMSEDGSLVYTPDGDPVVYDSPRRQFGQEREIALGEIRGDTLIVLGQPERPRSTPTASVQNAEYASWAVVEQLSIPSR